MGELYDVVALQHVHRLMALGFKTDEIRRVSVNFEFHLKESEWRWKKQPDELVKDLWQLIRHY